MFLCLFSLSSGLAPSLYGETVKASSEIPAMESSETSLMMKTPNETLDDAFRVALAQYNSQYADKLMFAITNIRTESGFAYAAAAPLDQFNQPIKEEVYIVLLAYKNLAGEWLVVAPKLVTNQEYNIVLESLPDTLIDSATKAFIYQYDSTIRSPVTALNMTGHKLPWPDQKTAQVRAKGNCYVNLTGGVSCDNSGHELQLDFNIEGSGINGDVYATKPGTVVFVKESSNQNCTTRPPNPCWKKANMVVVQHSTSEYTWYVHLAHNSVPVSVGNQIGFGTKIGVEGVTGFASGVHLHFMTSTGHTTGSSCNSWGCWTDPNNPDDAPWATGITAVDFAEVSWDSLAVESWYKSQNSGSHCPAPSPNSPADGYVSPSQTITFSWAALSGCPFNGYTLRIRTDTNMDASTPHIYDQGVGETSRSVDIPSSYNNQDLYWGVRAANAPNGADWSIRKFRIEPMTQPPRVSTTVNVPSIAPGGTALVSVSLLDAPPNTYASAEFICTFNATVVEARDIAFSNLFGPDAVPIVTTPQNGSFIAAIAGSNGNKATTGGEVLTFNLKGLQVGQTTIECTGRVSKGDNFAIPLPSSGSLLKVQSQPPQMGILRGQVIAAKPVTVKVRTPDNAIIPVPIQPDGTFILPVFPGNYTVDASASGFLSAETPQGSVTVRDGDTITLPTIRLLAGDIDGNNVINQLDAITIGMNYGTSTPAEADLNNDSVIDFLDLELLARNYLKTGPVAWQENNTNAETFIDPEVE